MKISDIQPGDLFTPELEDSTLLVVPAHTVLDGQLMPLDSGFLFDAKQALGPRFALEAAGAARRDNKGGTYGCAVIRNPVPVPKNGRGAGHHGVAVLQSRFAWWEEPSLHLISLALADLRKWMVANKGFPVRLGVPGLPYVPKKDIVAAINEAIPSYLQHRLTVVSRASKTTEEEFYEACTAPGVSDGDISDFLCWQEGVDNG